MDPVTIGIMLGLGLLFQGIGAAVSQGDKDKAESLRKQAMMQFGIDLPSVDVIAVHPEVVEYTASQVQGNLEAQQTRMDALRQLSRRAGEGYTIEERAALNQALGDVAAQERGAREAIINKLPAQSGARVAALLSNQQAAAQQANQQGLDIAAQGRRKALEALAASGRLAGDIDAATFNQAMQRAEAADAIARFNATNKLESARWNEMNRLNRDYERNRQLLAKAQGAAAAASGMSQYYQGQAQNTQQMFGQMGQSAQTGFGAYAGQKAYNDDPRVRLERLKAEKELERLGMGTDY